MTNRIDRVKFNIIYGENTYNLSLGIENATDNKIKKIQDTIKKLREEDIKQILNKQKALKEIIEVQGLLSDPSMQKIWEDNYSDTGVKVVKLKLGEDRGLTRKIKKKELTNIKIIYKFFSNTGSTSNHIKPSFLTLVQQRKRLYHVAMKGEKKVEGEDGLEEEFAGMTHGENLEERFFAVGRMMETKEFRKLDSKEKRTSRKYSKKSANHAAL